MVSVRSDAAQCERHKHGQPLRPAAQDARKQIRLSGSWERQVWKRMTFNNKADSASTAEDITQIKLQ